MYTLQLEMIGGPLDGAVATIRVPSLDLGDLQVVDSEALGYPAYAVSEWRGSRRWVLLFSAPQSGPNAAYQRSKGIENIKGADL